MQTADGVIVSGTVSFKPSRYDGGGVRYLRFRGWLEGIAADGGRIGAINFEEVRAHAGMDAAHVYGGLLATLTAWCEQHGIAYQGVPVGTIKRFTPAKGTLTKLLSSQPSAPAASIPTTTMRLTHSPSCCGQSRRREVCDDTNASP